MERGNTMEAGTSRLTLHSVGRADATSAMVLARALPLSREHVVRCVYQAPSVLLSGLPQEQAQTLCDLLARTGLDVGVDPADAPLAGGGPDYDVAVHVGDPARFREVAAAISAFVGCPLARAVEMLCASPAVVLGQVSFNTVQALADRLAPLGAAVDASRIQDARYDLFVDAGQPDLRQRLRRELAAFDVECQPEGPLLAAGLDRAAAQVLWQRHGSRGEAWRLLDQALQRFDIWLDAPAVGEAAVAALVSATGMPAALVDRVNSRLPFLLSDALPGAATGEMLLALHQAGVVASAKMVTLARWDLRLLSVADARAAALVLGRVGGLAEVKAVLALQRLPARLDLALTLARGRWLEAELSSIGCRCELEPR
jgi:hypothetical protein